MENSCHKVQKQKTSTPKLNKQMVRGIGAVKYIQLYVCPCYVLPEMFIKQQREAKTMCRVKSKVYEMNILEAK